ncbi:hypothetical protein AAVH_35090 [Aphelenchoides avenae]|nr:hypothetical protein AAVH_35090 [Aphelenchus avenae]
MIPELRYELLFFYTRNDLERLQPLSRSLLDMIVKGSKVLPLRPIRYVNMASAIYKDPQEDKIRIFVEERRPASDTPPEPNYEASIDDGDSAEIFRRLQHTCIKHFWVGIRESAFLRYWRAQETASFAVLCLEFGGLEIADYRVLDSIVNHLRPTTIGEVDDDHDPMLELLARNSFLNSLQICTLNVWYCPFPPPSFILEEPGYPRYDLWCSDRQVADGIDDLIESFVREGCANKKLELVCIQWEDDENQQSFALKQLKKPTKVDMPLPDLAAWLTDTDHRVRQCEKYSFENAKQWQRMVAYKWAVEYDDPYGRCTRHILQCRIENL